MSAGRIIEAHGSVQGQAELDGVGAVARGAEVWQFFAFMFGALVTLALALLDEMPDRLWPWRIAAKVVAFFGLGYFLLVDRRVRVRLALLLQMFKEDRR
jgi:hypothetical protein